MMKIAFTALFLCTHIVSAQQLIVSDEKEVVYFFSYKSPGSHAMSNAHHAYQIVHEKFSLPGTFYSVPYLSESADKGAFQAAVAYFMVQLNANIKGRAARDSIPNVELVIYALFKQFDITSKEQIIALMGAHVLVGEDSAYLSALYEDAAVYARQSAMIQAEFSCVTLPCARIANDRSFREVTLASSSNSIKEFWENVSLSLAVID